MGYPYFYRAIDYGKEGTKNEMGCAIFSKYPIVDSGRAVFNGPVKLRAAESLISCDLDVNGQTIRIYTTHLQSVLLQKKDYRDISIIRNAEDSIVEASKSLIRKLRMAYSQRGNQVDIVRNKLDSCPVPEVICGDYNDVPNSYTYFRIRGNRRDAFMELLLEQCGAAGSALLFVTHDARLGRYFEQVLGLDAPVGAAAGAAP